MAFDRKRAERTLVDVLPGGSARGMGFRLGEDLILTACHCLPRVPRADPLGGEVVAVRVRKPGTKAVIAAAALFADPCGDLAILSHSPIDGSEFPNEEGVRAMIGALEPASPELAPALESQVFIFTHKGTWVEGVAKQSFIYVDKPVNRLRRGTSGAPVFNKAGRVVGIVSSGSGHGPTRMCLLADHLPGWVLRRAADAETALKRRKRTKKRNRAARRPSGSAGSRR